jgi:hypothetical protein
MKKKLIPLLLIASILGSCSNPKLTKKIDQIITIDLFRSGGTNAVQSKWPIIEMIYCSPSGDECEKDFGFNYSRTARTNLNEFYSNYYASTLKTYLNNTNLNEFFPAADPNFIADVKNKILNDTYSVIVANQDSSILVIPTNTPARAILPSDVILAFDR